MMQYLLPIIWRVIRLMLMAPLALSLIVVAWLLSTKEGTQFIANVANNQLPELKIEGVSGYVLGDLTVDYLQWVEDSVIVTAHDIRVNWAPLCLLEKNICLEQVSAGQLIVNVLPSAEDDASDGTLPSIVMPVGIVADSADIQTLQLIIAGQTHTIADLKFNGRWVGSLLALSQAVANYQGLGVDVKGKMDFSTPWVSQFSGRVGYRLPDNISKQPLGLEFDLQGSQRVFGVKGDLSGDWPVKLSSTISFDDPRLPLTVKFESPTSWQIPLAGEQASIKKTQLDINQFAASASLRDFTLQATSRFKTAFWSELDLSIDGQWLDSGLILNHVHLDSKDGQVQLKGALQGTTQIPFDVMVNTRALALHKAMIPGDEPATPILPFPVVMDSEWRISGYINDGRPDITFNLKQFKGHVNESQIVGKALFSYDATMWRVNELLASSGVNQLSATGELNSDGSRFNNVEMHFSIPEPQQWLPGVSGSLEGGVSIDGTVDMFDLHGELSTEMLSYRDVSVGSIESVFDIAQSGMKESMITISAENLRFDDSNVESTDWQIQGDREGSSVQGNVVVHDVGAVAVNCDISWNIEIHDAIVTEPLKGRIESECNDLSWRSDVAPYSLFTPHNTKPILINWNIDESALVINPFCLIDESIEVCSHEDASWSSEKGYYVGVSTKKLPVKQLVERWNSIAEEGNRLELLGLQGDLDGFAKISQQPGGMIDAEMAMNMPMLDLGLARNRGTSFDSRSKHHLKDDDNAPVHLVFEPLALKALMRNDNITAEARFLSPQLGAAKTRLTITDIAKQRLINGELSLNQLDLSLLQDFLPSIEHISGLFSSKLSLSGTLKQPALLGGFSLSGGALKSDYLPEILDGIAIEGAFDHQQLSYQGGFSAAAAQASLEGTLNWQHDWVLQTSLNSDAFDITPRSGVTVTIKPNLALLLREGFADISGQFEIPHARIRLDELPEGTKSVSSDVRIIGEDSHSSDTQWAYKANVKLMLGDDVHFRGFGVNTYLTGHLLLQLYPGRALGGTGEINTDDGFYTIFGQRLTIKEGRFIFNGPIERPDLQLDAMRSISGSSVKVGVKVTGPANEPEVNFYSQPAMNESRVIHYLLTGREPDQGSNNADLLNNMMLSAGIFGSGEVTEKWANKVGVTDVQISTQSDEDGTSLEVSGYLSPDIYLKYGASLYDEAKTVAMRYRLRPNLFLEAAGGLNSSLDIIYSFERE